MRHPTRPHTNDADRWLASGGPRWPEERSGSRSYPNFLCVVRLAKSQRAKQLKRLLLGLYDRVLCFSNAVFLKMSTEIEKIQKAFEAFAVESTNGLPFLPSIRVEEALRMAGATDLSVGECVLFTLFSFLLLLVLYTSSSSS